MGLAGGRETWIVSREPAKGLAKLVFFLLYLSPPFLILVGRCLCSVFFQILARLTLDPNLDANKSAYTIFLDLLYILKAQSYVILYFLNSSLYNLTFFRSLGGILFKNARDELGSSFVEITRRRLLRIDSRTNRHGGIAHAHHPRPRSFGANAARATKKVDEIRESRADASIVLENTRKPRRTCSSMSFETKRSKTHVERSPFLHSTRLRIAPGDVRQLPAAVQMSSMSIAADY